MELDARLVPLVFSAVTNVSYMVLSFNGSSFMLVPVVKD